MQKKVSFGGELFQTFNAQLSSIMQSAVCLFVWNNVMYVDVVVVVVHGMHEK